MNADASPILYADLFSGAGGLSIGAQHLLGWRSACYVERDPFCAAVLRARADDGLLDKAPVFRDAHDFLRDGFAERLRGVARVVAAGFPCQPWSLAVLLLAGEAGEAVSAP